MESLFRMKDADESDASMFVRLVERRAKYGCLFSGCCVGCLNGFIFKTISVLSSMSFI